MHRIRSFLLTVSDQTGTVLDRFAVPVAAADPFINALFRALSAADHAPLREPWYQLVPYMTTGPTPAPPIPAPPLPHPPGLPPITLIPDPHDPIQALTVTLYDTQRMLYTAEYSTVEVFGSILIALLRRRIDTGSYYSAGAGPFRVRVDPQTTDGDPRMVTLLPAAVPIEGAFTLPTVRSSSPRATFQPLDPPDFATRSLAAFAPFTTVKPDLPSLHQVLWQPAAFQALTHTQPVSATVEVGGYLIGQVYRQREAPTRLLIEVQQVLAAAHTQASATLLIFTGESWSILHRRLDGDLRGLRLVGWWHTHLFPATDTFGLSGLDETLHRQFFTQPWQLAALLNVSPEQGRVLRCYLPDAQQVLQECGYRVLGGEQHPPPALDPAPPDQTVTQTRTGVSDD